MNINNEKNNTCELFSELYDVAFSWDISAEAESINTLIKYCENLQLNNVCDLGAGTGRFLSPLLQIANHIWLVEPNDGMWTVLKRKLDALSKNDSKRITAHHGYLENLKSPVTFDGVLLLTDVLSYLWPEQRMINLVKEINKNIKDNGILILDVAIWKGQPGETRYESWTETFENKIVKALYSAKLYPIYGYTKNELIRIEKLSFEAFLDNEHLYASKQSILHAFSMKYLKNLMSKLGFRYIAAVVPGNKKIVIKAKGLEKRLMIAFSKGIKKY